MRIGQNPDLDFEVQNKKPSRLTHVLPALFVSSGVFNVLGLTGPLFMMLVIDRVLATNGTSTLIVLFMLACFAFVFMFFMDICRRKIMFRYACEYLQIDPQISEGLAGGILLAFFDLIWVIVYLAVCFVLHPALGGLALVITLIHALALIPGNLIQAKINKLQTIAKDLSNACQKIQNARISLQESDPVITRATTKLRKQTSENGLSRLEITENISVISAILGTIRSAGTTGIIALGAWLVILGEASPGAIIACSFLLQRCCAPLEMLRGQWSRIGLIGEILNSNAGLPRNIDETRQSQGPVGPVRAAPIKIEITNVSFGSSDKRRILFQIRLLTASAGDLVVMKGPVGSGKSKLMRGMSGLLPVLSGSYKLNGTSINRSRISELVYVPEIDGELELRDFLVNDFSEIAAHPARHATSVQIIDYLGFDLETLHDIRSQMQGCQTGQVLLSGDIRKRLALLRAFTQSAGLIILDQPTACLESGSVTALVRTIGFVLRQNKCVILASNHSELLVEASIIGHVSGARINKIETAHEPHPTIRVNSGHLGIISQAVDYEKIRANR